MDMTRRKLILNCFLMLLQKGKKSVNTMQTNNLFTFQRFGMLCKQSLIINKKLIGLSLAGFVGILFIALIVLQSASNFDRWENNDCMVTFVFLFFQLGILYSGLSFPSFRSKEKS